MSTHGTDARQISIELPFPPSINHYWRHVMIGGFPRVLISREGRAYRDAVQEVINGRVSPLSGRLIVEVDVWMPNLRKRDLDNLLKALLDACTHAGVWGDDSQIHNLRIVRRGVDRPKGRIELHAKQLERTLF